MKGGRLRVLLFILFLLALLVQSSIDPYSSSFAAVEDEEEEEEYIPRASKKKPASSRSSNSRSAAYQDDDDDDDDEEDDEVSNRKLRKSRDQPPPPPPPPPPANSESLIIHLVPHTHVDQGWLKTTDGYEETVFDILNSVTQHLDLDPKRKFVWAEVWYFKRWFDTLPTSKRERVRRLVRDSRFEFVGGGLVSGHDESLASQRLVQEQVCEGHTYLEQTFGIAQPRIAWQIDTFGHSDSTPALLSKLGFSIVVLNHVHFRVKQRFRKGQHLEFLWRSPKPFSSDAVRSSSSSSMEDDSTHQIFAHMLPMSYASPEGHDFEKAGTRQVTAPRGRATKLIQYAKEMSRAFRTHHVMIPWGDDFRFKDAEKQFGNMDKILAEVAMENPTIKIQYSTATEYFEALQRSAATSALRFPTFSGDFAQYADAGDAYWTGIYSSRATLKRLAKQAENQVFLAGFLFSFARAKSGAVGHIPKIQSVEVETGRVVVDDNKPAPSWGMGLYRSLVFAKRQSSLVGTHHHAITGQAKDLVAKDFMKRAKASVEAASRVAMESLSVLVAKRKADTSSTRTLVHARPSLKVWNQLTDSLEIKEDGKQWPLIFTNEQSAFRKEVVQIRLDVNNFALTKRIRVVDSTGSAVVGQVHRAVVGGNEDWKTDIVLLFLVEVPPLGYSTYFVSCTSPADRLASSQNFAQQVPVTVYNLKRGRIQATHSTNLDGVKVSTTLAVENSNGGCYGIDNDLVAVEMDCDSGLIKAWINKKTKKRTLVKQEFRAHESSRGGSALFRPDRLESSLIQFKSQLTVGLVKGPLVQEVQVLADGVTQVVRVIRAPNTPDVSLEAHVLVSTAVAGVNPDTDTVVRFTTDLKTGGRFYTDTPSGALRERKGVLDTPLAANFFPCAAGLVLKGEQQRNAPPLVFGMVFNQPVSCTGAANIAANSAGSEFGVVELVLHRNPTADDGRGLGEGLNDYGVSRLDMFLFLDQTESAMQRRIGLVRRITTWGDYWIAQMERSALLAPLLNREVWVSKFTPTLSLLNKFPVEDEARIVSIFPRDETSDEVLVRVETLEAASQLDFALAFPAVDWIVFGAREFKPKSATAITFQASDRADDFTFSDMGEERASLAGSGGFVLSEHAIKEIESAADEASSNSKSSNKKKKAAAAAATAAAANNRAGGGASAAQAAFPGGLLPSCPVINVKSFASAGEAQFDLKRGMSKVFAVGLLYIPDERLIGAGEKKRPATQQQQQRVPPPNKAVVLPRQPMVIVDEIEDHDEQQQQQAKPNRGKSLTSLRADLAAEEKRSAALEARSTRLQKNVDDLLRELDLFQDIDGGLDKKAALEELNRAEEQLLEGNLMLKESKEKAAALQWELGQAEAQGGGEGRSSSRLHSSMPASYQESSLHGFFAGAGGMLLVVVAFQWFTGRRQKHRQAFVPVGVRYNPPQNSFAVPTKRL